jgi:tripartite-type tricarboxylate transporter receptor subunit TctC
MLPCVAGRMPRHASWSMARSTSQDLGVARLGSTRVGPMQMGPAEFRAFVEAELPRWREIVRAPGVQLD